MKTPLVTILRAAEAKDHSHEERYIALIGEPKRNWVTSETLFGLKAKLEELGCTIVDWEPAERELLSKAIYTKESI